MFISTETVYIFYKRGENICLVRKYSKENMLSINVATAELQ
jgi:predicted transport protein